MNNVSKTLYIPLYGKSYVSKRGLFLSDRKAEQIWAAEGFPLRGKSRSKWLAFYMGIRAAVFDEWIRGQLSDLPDAVVLHIGCGLDSRCLRLGDTGRMWYDVDFPEVIGERTRFYGETVRYQMIPADVRVKGWLSGIPQKKCAIVVMEGVSMYLTPDELRGLADELSAHFEQVACLMDCYTGLAARLSRYKNPINDVGVTQVYGMDDPESIHSGVFRFVREHPMTPQKYIDMLTGLEKAVFKWLYAGGLSKKLYRLFEYRKG